MKHNIRCIVDIVKLYKCCWKHFRMWRKMKSQWVVNREPIHCFFLCCWLWNDIFLVLLRMSLVLYYNFLCFAFYLTTFEGQAFLHFRAWKGVTSVPLRSALFYSVCVWVGTHAHISCLSMAMKDVREIFCLKFSVLVYVLCGLNIWKTLVQ